MNPYITITRVPYEEPYHICLVLEASNGRLQGQIEFYSGPETLTGFGDVLDVFPRHAFDNHLWEGGSERPEDRSAYYFRLRLFTIDSVGHCAIQFRFNNNKELPDREISEFCILADPVALNRLGKLVGEFAKLEHEFLYWDLTEGRLFQTRAEYDAQ